MSTVPAAVAAPAARRLARAPLLAGAAIGRIECNHGRSQLSGCNPPGTVNGAGATGPMQFLGATWRRGTPSMTVPVVGPPTRATIDGYAADGDGDGVADVWNP